jgi:hypothetical protein
MRFLLVLGLVALAACGADGAPERPGQAGTGVTVSGSVEVGVTGGG